MVSDRTQIDFRLTTPGCMPTQAYEGDAGWDLYVAQRVVLEPFETVDVPCGFDIALPDGMWARIAARSSTARRHGIMIGDAVIDAGYRGPMFVCMTLIRSGCVLVVEKGWRLAQLILHRVEPVAWNPVTNLKRSARGAKAFGSSGL